MNIITTLYDLLWGDLFTLPLPGGSSIGISLMILLLIPTGIYFTIRTKFLLIRFFPEMFRISIEKRPNDKRTGISGLQALIVSTATRVGMGNMVGVVSAVSLGGAGAVFWMWVTAIIGSSTAFVEATLAQLHKQEDPLYGGYRGGPSYYIHNMFANLEQKHSKNKFVDGMYRALCKLNIKRWNVIAVLFALSGLLCWCGISQVISNSVSESFQNAFNIPPIASTIFIVALSAVIVLRKNATVKVLDIVVPIMACLYFFITIFVIVKNFDMLPEVLHRILAEALGFKQIAGGGIGAALSFGVQRGLFSNEAGSGSAPCAAAASDVNHPAKAGLLQAFGVFIDTIIICTCTAMVMLLVPEGVLDGLSGMALLQTAMHHHFGPIGVVFIAITLWLFCFSTFIGILYYARSNVAYVFGDNWKSQTIFKIVALVMLFIGGLAAYEFVWILGDIGIALMTIFNIFTILFMGKEALDCLKEYQEMKEAHATHNGVKEAINAILKAIAVAMGIAVMVLSTMHKLDPTTGFTLLGIGLTCLAITRQV